MYRHARTPTKIYAWPFCVLLFHLSTAASLSHDKNQQNKLTMLTLVGVRREIGKPFISSSNCEMLLWSTPQLVIKANPACVYVLHWNKTCCSSSCEKGTFPLSGQQTNSEPKGVAPYLFGRRMEIRSMSSKVFICRKGTSLVLLARFFSCQEKESCHAFIVR